MNAKSQPEEGSVSLGAALLVRLILQPLSCLHRVVVGGIPKYHRPQTPFREALRSSMQLVNTGFQICALVSFLTLSSLGLAVMGLIMLPLGRCGSAFVFSRWMLWCSASFSLFQLPGEEGEERQEPAGQTVL